MRILVTAGNTQTPIDRVRCITNIFTGRTGASIALEAYRRGHQVTLATSHPEIIDAAELKTTRWQCLAYRTFDELDALMADHLVQEAIIHCAAVGDYHASGIFAPADGTRFDERTQTWAAGTMLDRSAGKVKSDEPELWLRLVRAPKLVDKIRSEWNFHGALVKFKLEVGVSNEALLAIAEKSRLQSKADWMVANTLEGAAEWAFVGNELGYKKVTRDELAGAVLDALESTVQESIMANVLLGVTGSVAAIYTPQLFEDLRQAGHDVKIVATKSSLYFFDAGEILPSPPAGEGLGVRGTRNKDAIILDEDEWSGDRYQRGDPVLHIELRRWADVLLIAPCDANTLAKLALGITDNCLTCVYLAWEPSKPVILAPAMNTLMWQHPVTSRHLAQIMSDLRGSLHVVEPIEKKLACDDVGIGALAERAAILDALGRNVSPLTTP